MTRFIQIHTLTGYPPSNLNRDDLGRPKTAIVGGTNRLRISSQSLKRAWRTSDVFETAFNGQRGHRTKRLGEEVHQSLLDGGISEKDAKAWAGEIAGVFGKLSSDGLLIEQLAHVSPDERAAVDEYVKKLIARKSGPTKEEKVGTGKDAKLPLLRHENTAIDIAMFGRMLAGDPAFNKDAAVQVAHAFTIHPVTVEDDYFTAVDDLKTNDDDRGAAHVGNAEFGSGVFYQYVCVNREGLIKNLDGDEALARRGIRALIEALTQVAPKGKQNTFAAHSRSSHVIIEKGDRQPRSLSTAFFDGVQTPFLDRGFERMTSLLANMDKAYGAHEKRLSMNVLTGEGSLSELLDFASE